ncbi:MAG: double zinc ribbon domain-containing protein [Candidatus Binatia bacterium]
MYCEQCQTEYPEGRKFCPQCGTLLAVHTLLLSEEEPPSCPACGRELQPGKKFCLHCGHRIIEGPKLCPSCGISVPPEAKFCGDCGASLVRTNGTEAPITLFKPPPLQSPADHSPTGFSPQTTGWQETFFQWLHVPGVRISIGVFFLLAVGFSSYWMGSRSTMRIGDPLSPPPSQTTESSLPSPAQPQPLT